MVESVRIPDDAGDSQLMSAKGIGIGRGISGRAGRAGRRLRPLFNRTATAQRPVVIPSWRATPVSLLWPRVSYSPAVSPNLYLTSRRSPSRDVTSDATSYPHVRVFSVCVSTKCHT